MKVALFASVRRMLVFSLPICIGLIVVSPANAVIVFGGSEGQNQSAPNGSFQDSGWQYEGTWQVGAGTAIAPHFFLTAKHLGGNLGDSFVQNGASYTVTAIYNDPAGSDLALVQVAQAFTSYAQLYRNGDELSSGGKVIAVFGAGTMRGDAIVGPLGNEGYAWAGGPTGHLSWGASQVSGIESFSGGPNGDFLSGTFTAAASILGQPSSTLSVGDSGGGVFIKDTDGIWKLAGVNYGVDGPYSLDSSFTNTFIGAMFDTRGFYYGSADSYVYNNPALPNPVGQSFYATRVSSKTAFIDAITTVPEPGGSGLLFAGIALIVARRRLSVI